MNNQIFFFYKYYTVFRPFHTVFHTYHNITNIEMTGSKIFWSKLQIKFFHFTNIGVMIKSSEMSRLRKRSNTYNCKNALLVNHPCFSIFPHGIRVDCKKSFFVNGQYARLWRWSIARAVPATRLMGRFISSKMLIISAWRNVYVELY